MKRRRSSQKGAAAVEFAIVLLPLILILFGVIEFGLFMYNKQVITNASREGARYGIVYHSAVEPHYISTGEIEQKAKDYYDKYMITFKTVPQEDPQVLTTCQAMGDPLTVKVTYKYSFLVIPNFILGIGQYVPITAQTVMRCE